MCTRLPIERTGARWAKRLGVPLVFTFHTLYTEYVHYFPISKLVRRTLRWYLQQFCNGCDLIITAVRRQKNDQVLRRYYPIVVIATEWSLCRSQTVRRTEGFGGGSGVGGDAGGNAGAPLTTTTAPRATPPRRQLRHR